VDFDSPVADLTVTVFELPVMEVSGSFVHTGLCSVASIVIRATRRCACVFVCVM
jgi:hypothetical protein